MALPLYRHSRCGREALRNCPIIPDALWPMVCIGQVPTDRAYTLRRYPGLSISLSSYSYYFFFFSFWLSPSIDSMCHLPLLLLFRLPLFSLRLNNFFRHYYYYLFSIISFTSNDICLYSRVSEIIPLCIQRSLENFQYDFDFLGIIIMI